MGANPAVCVGTINCDINVSGERTYSVKYLVQTTDVDDQGITAVRAVGIPSIGQYYAVGNDSDRGAFVKRYTPRLEMAEGSRKLWEVMVQFESAGSQSDPTQNANLFYDFPWLEPARISGSGTKTEVPARWHYSNPDSGAVEVLQNSAGAYFDDETRDDSNFGISIAKKYAIADFDLQECLTYVDCVNDDTFFGAPRDYYKMAAPRWSLLYTGEGLAYWDVQFEFEGRPDGWNEQDRPDALKKIDEGYYYIDQTVTPYQIKRFTDDELFAISGKGRLNGAGDKLTPWDAMPVHYPANGVNKYLRVDFADLGIPTDIGE